jgi:hypothetical protein
MPTATSFCFLVSQVQVSAALGHAVGAGSTTALRECQYPVTHAGGLVGIMVWGFANAAGARGFFDGARRKSQAGETVTAVSGLGQAAVALTEPGGPGAAAMVLTGIDVVTVASTWPPFTAQMAVTLVREAYRNAIRGLSQPPK